jgi:23S rRNA pseudouridine1911/1915/1917 synthase
VHHGRGRGPDLGVVAAREDVVIGGITYIADDSDAGTRIDVAIAQRTGFSRALVSAAIKDGTVRINDAPVKPSRLIEPGDRVWYAIAPRPPLTVAAKPIPLSIAYEDDAVLVVDKPAGMVTHPAHGAREDTLVNALLAHAPGLPGERLRAGLVHRLDRDTSGLLLVAKTEAALGTLGRAMQRRYIERVYRGIVVGVPADPEGTIRGAIGRDPRNRLKYAIRADGRPAITHYVLREALHHAAELEFRLETGRTHQIRVHLAALGLPILNDPLYGRLDPRSPLPGQALHAWRLAFKHPVTKRALSFESPPPPDYLTTLERLRAEVRSG